MDDIDRAQAQEQLARDAAIANARAIKTRNIEADICTGCNYATKASWGKTCDSWRECLIDLQKRERRQ